MASLWRYPAVVAITCEVITGVPCESSGTQTMSAAPTTSQPPSGETTQPPASGSSGGTTTPSTPVTALAATVTSAPADGATVSGTVSILVAGSALQNVELLPATGYLPMYARGSISADKTSGVIQLDTRTLPDGPIAVRVAAFDAPPGVQAGTETTAMPPRTWTIQNGAPAPAFSATLEHIPPSDWSLRRPSGSMDFVVHGTGMENVELVSANDPTIRYGTFTISPDKTSATLSFKGGGYSTYYLRILAWDRPAGQGGNMIEVMPRTRFTSDIPSGCQAGFACNGTAP